MNSQDILKQLSCHYPLSTSPITYRNHKDNVVHVGHFIEYENISTFHSYPRRAGRTERELVVLYKTASGERIGYQFSGQRVYEEDSRPVHSSSHRNMYEFSPCILTGDGTILRELTSEDIWNLFTRLSEVDDYVIPVIATLFFKLGRLYSHIHVKQDCECILFERRHNEEHTYKSLEWSKLEIERAILSSLNELIGYISIDTDYAISFEAFLYFWELQYIKEDIISYTRERFREPRRISLSNMVLLYANFFYGNLSIGKLLQQVSSVWAKLVLTPDEVSLATTNAIQMSDRVRDLFEFMKTEGIQVNQRIRLNIAGKEYGTIFQIPAARIYIVRFLPPEMADYFQQTHWNAYTAQQLEDAMIFENIKRILKNT